MKWQSWSPLLQAPRPFAHVIVWPLTSTRAGTIVESEIALADWSVLDDEERARATRFVFDRHRIAYVEAHVGMRRILAAYLQVEPPTIAFVADRLGKPRLAGKEPALRFSLSHTDGLCALGVCSSEAEIGVDVERLRSIEPEVAKAHFSRSEQVQLAALDGLAWREGFFRCWTRKEALLKAEGLGLHVRLDAFDVSLTADQPAALLGKRAESRITRAWHLHHFEPNAYVTGAVALSSIRQPGFFHWRGV